MKELKWITISIYIDEYTGEILQKKLIDLKQYYIHKKNKKFYETTKHRVIEYTNICRTTGQQSIFTAD